MLMIGFSFLNVKGKDSFLTFLIIIRNINNYQNGLFYSGNETTKRD